MEAVKWFQKAAEQGPAEAQFNLGQMYHKGEGVSQDEVESYAWYLLAKVNGNRESSKVIPNVEERLTLEEIHTGQARAAELRRLIGAK